MHEYMRMIGGRLRRPGRGLQMKIRRQIHAPLNCPFQPGQPATQESSHQLRFRLIPGLENTLSRAALAKTGDVVGDGPDLAVIELGRDLRHLQAVLAANIVGMLVGQTRVLRGNTGTDDEDVAAAGSGSSPRRRDSPDTIWRDHSGRRGVSVPGKRSAAGGRLARIKSPRLRIVASRG